MRAHNVCKAMLGFCFIANPIGSAHSAPWPAVREFGGAIPKNIDSWIEVKDYPSRSLSSGEQGNVIVMFDITADGKAKNCKIESSSGYNVLDQVPCKLIERRARFKPATGSDGAPIETKARYSVAFWIP